MKYCQHEILPEQEQSASKPSTLKPLAPLPSGPEAAIAASRPCAWRAGGLLAGAILLVGHGTAFADETGMAGSPIFDQSINGDFVVAGSSTRQFGAGTAQANTFNLTVAGIPAGSTVVKAYANWSFLTDNPNNAALASIQINGNNVAGAISGRGSPDLGWSQNQGASYLADVTSLVLGNGTYSVAGATDKSGALGEGISLVVVYQKLSLPTKMVDVYSGYTSTASGNATAAFRFGTAYSGGPAHFFINALDGQLGFSDDFYVNGSRVSGILGGGSVGDAWQGNLGPGAGGNNLYDHAEGDVSTYMNIGDTTLTAQTLGAGNNIAYNDFIGHSFGAISFIPEPGTLTLTVLGLAGLLLAQRRSRRAPPPPLIGVRVILRICAQPRPALPFP